MGAALASASSTAPVVEKFDGVHVVRDDLFPGGTKARFLPLIFEGVTELVYASPCEGGAQTALATVAANLGKRATIFIAKRAVPHPRGLMAKRLGAAVYQVSPGYLSVVRARAKAYAAAHGATLAPFGINLPEAATVISAAARSTGIKPDEVWCASGSGVLARALALAFPDARRHVVQIGRTLTPMEVAGAEIHVHPLKFEQALKARPPFPSDPHYDAKAWELAARRASPGKTVLFWNVTGPATP